MGNANITNRMAPLIERHRELETVEFMDEHVRDEAIFTIKELGLFSIPMLTDILKEAKRERDEIVNTDIPLLLAEYGLSLAVLDDGTKVTKDTFWEVSQKDKDKDVLAAWLKSHGYQSIIKDTLEFEKGTDLSDLVAFLEAEGLSYERASEVHSATLKKVIREHVEAGGELPPEDAVKVSIFERGVVSFPKLKKGF